MADLQKELIKQCVSNIYDLQTVRIAMGNRMLSCFINTKKDEDIDYVEDLEDIEVVEEQDTKLVTKILKEYELINKLYSAKYRRSSYIGRFLRDCGEEFVYIKNELSYNTVEMFAQAFMLEKKAISICSYEVYKHPMWNGFFKDVKGCGPIMAAICITYFDPYKARWPSSFWRYAGLDVVYDESGAHGRCRKDRVKQTYIDKDGKEAVKDGLGYNPFVKTKLLGVLGSSFIKTGKGGKYQQVYYNYRNRLENRPDCKDLRPIVIHRRSIRYAVKIFLQDMWVAWRTIEGLPVGQTYAEAKLGMEPHKSPRNELISEMNLKPTI